MVNLSSRSQQYAANAGAWNTELSFLNVETAFLQGLLQDCGPGKQVTDFMQRRDFTSNKFLKLEVDKNYLNLVLNEQLDLLNQTKEYALPEYETAMACKQLELGYLMTTLNREYRELKKELFLLIDGALLKK
jgi:hypothetical protein